MSRRLASVAAALVLTACSVPFLSSTPPLFGFITVTSAGEPLVGGSDDVPPTLDLLLQAEAPFSSGDVDATLDGRSLPISYSNGNASATTAAMPLGSSHSLAITIAGRAQGISIDFSVIAATQAQLAAHIDPNSGLVLDAAFDDAPNRAQVAAVLPGASLTWVDATHVRAVWGGKPPGAVTLTPTITTARGSHLAAPVTLALGGIQPGTVRRAVEPAAPSVSGIPLVAFVVNTDLGNSSFFEHEGALQWVNATGWQAQPDGSILGTPDPVAVQEAQQARLPVWADLANDPSNPGATTQLLHTPAATSQLIGIVVNSVVDGGFAGVNVDFEGMAATDKDAFTGFVQALATALHAQKAQLMVDVVPHNASGTNAFSAAYDVPALGAAADYIDLMAYDEHGDGGTPGPVAGLDWDRSLLAYTLPGLNPAHTFLGIPLYARSWSDSNGGAGSYGDKVSQALATPGARIDYDFAAETPYIVSPDGSNLTYFDDADSLARKIALVPKNRLAGVAAWRLGFESPDFWSLFG
jgi:spore germination protein YaaH